MRHDPGARLTRMELLRVKVIGKLKAAKEHWEIESDRWEESVVHEDMTQREYRKMLRKAKEPDGPLAAAWRVFRRWQRWDAVTYFGVKRFTREYHDSRHFGTGG